LPNAPLADRLDGLLFFPVTAFDNTGAVALEPFREHVRQGIEAGAAGVFAGCGTGEFSALDLDEFSACIAAAVEVADGRVPVVAGAGYGTALGKQFLDRAAAAGADGALVLPPYLVDGGQEGLREHYEQLADAAEIDLIIYQRGSAIFEPATVAALARHPRIVGFKDGHGDVDLMQRILTTDHSDLLYLNGLPTAEVSQAAYQAIGVNVYSSAVFCFAPEIAMAFYTALRGGDDALVRRLLDEFYVPFVELRRLGSGYAVALVKAGVRLGGLDVGTVRAPLREPDDEHVKALAELIERGRRIVRA
jgi:5-dehydro-4-deoxyglucarate dehydratase